MSDMNDQQAQQPRGAAPGGTAATAPGAGARQETAATTDAARGYVPRPAPGYDDVRAGRPEPSGAALGSGCPARTSS